MKQGIVFDAPWGLSLKLITLFSTGILVGTAVVGLLNNFGDGMIWFIGMVVFPLAILMGAAIFMIRGYELTRDKLYIQRLGWKTPVNLHELQAVEIDPQAMKRSIRIFGNGGLFCFAGQFQNKKLGAYRAFATNPDLAVILRFTEKVVVVTPDNPNKFMTQIKNMA
jgi:hypothetical protein